MAKATPTVFDSTVASDIPNLDPQKRVGGGEFVKATTDTKELTTNSGIVEKALDSLGLKPLKEHQAAAAAKKAAREQQESADENGAGYNGQPGLNPAPISPYSKTGNTQSEASPIDAALGKIGVSVPKDSDDFFSLENNPLLKGLDKNSIKDILTDENGDLDFDGKALFENMADSLGGGAIKNLMSKDEISEIMDLMSDFSGAAGYAGVSDAFEFVGQISDGVVKYSKAGLGSATGILGMLDVVSGNDEIFSYTDVGGEASFVHALISKAVDYDLGEYIDKLTGKFYDTETQQVSIEMNISRAASANAYDRWHELYDRLEDGRKEKLKEKHLRELVMYFAIKKDDVEVDKINKLISCLNKVDSGWNVDPISGLPYLYYYSFASRDCISAFSLLDDHRPYAMAGSKASYKSSNYLRSVSFPITSWY